MLSTRPSVVSILSDYYKLHPQAREANRDESVRQLKAGNYPGIFNQYPALLWESDLPIARSRFTAILRAIKWDSVNDDKEIIDAAIREKIDAFILDVARMASGLLLEQGKVSQVLINYLRLDDWFNTEDLLKDKAFDVVLSYFLEVFAEVRKYGERQANLYEDAREVAENYISKNKSRIIRDAMLQPGSQISLRCYLDDMDMVKNLPTEYPRETRIAAAVGGGVLIAALGIGITLFSLLSGGRNDGPGPVNNPGGPRL